MKLDNNKIRNKWGSALSSMGLTGSKLDLMSKYANQHALQEDKSPDYSILPIALRITPRTVAQDLVFASKDEIDSVKSRIVKENRSGKIESIINDKDFTEKKLEDDDEYKGLMKKGVEPMRVPSNSFLYLDYKYQVNKNDKV